MHSGLYFRHRGAEGVGGERRWAVTVGWKILKSHRIRSTVGHVQTCRIVSMSYVLFTEDIQRRAVSSYKIGHRQKSISISNKRFRLFY